MGSLMANPVIFVKDNMVYSSHPSIKQLTLLKKIDPLHAKNGLRILPLYLVPMFLYLCVDDLAGYIAFGFLLFFHAMSFCFSLWFVKVNSFINYIPVKELSDAQFILVETNPNCGSNEIVPLERGNIARNLECKGDLGIYTVPEYFFKFQCLLFVTVATNNGVYSFERIEFPEKLPLRKYMSNKGLNFKSYDLSKTKYGFNSIDIPVPKYWDLIVQHITAPFFLFQVFSVLLWSLDDSFVYSLFTLFMLYFMESQLVNQRITSVKQLREMRTKPASIFVLRDNQWRCINSEYLVPGDLVSISSKPLDRKTEDSISPCDILLLEGTCVVNEAVLTGESVPHSKQGLLTTYNEEMSNELLGIDIDNDKHKRNMIFGGTKIITHQIDPFRESRGLLKSIPKAPNDGCFGYVVRTGYYTSQGDMMRQMLYSNDKMSANNKESFYFILCLLIFAVIAGIYVLRHGYNDPRRNRYKLVLHCIMIITNVVPPELPLELSFAVNTSLIQLVKLGVYCTEPFRIPFAGKIKTLFFDKTGTLTSDRLKMKGVLTCNAPTPSGDTLIPVEKEEDPNGGYLYTNQQYPPLISTCLATCHELANVNGELLGNLMEIVMVNESGYTYTNNNMATPPKYLKNNREYMNSRVLFRYPFESVMKRMSVVISNDSQRNIYRVFTKGAPEVIRGLLSSLPSNYDHIYREHMLRGERILALATKEIPSVSMNELQRISRASIESSLEFIGFMVLTCPLKPTTRATIETLTDCDLQPKIITGDNAYTACEVAKNCGIISKEKNICILDLIDNRLQWEYIRGDSITYVPVDYNASVLQEMKEQYTLCIAGTSLLSSPESLAFLAPYVTIFSRMSPQQKGLVVAAYKDQGVYTLMCGDGTNDVAALKQAHVGVSIMNNVSLEDHIMELEETETQLKKHIQSNEEQTPLLNNSDVVPPYAIQVTPNQRSTADYNSIPSASRADDAISDYQRKLDQLRAELEDETGMMKLGDASIASPFTCKSTGIDSVLEILRWGRCTLVSTLQIYMILALNSLVSAYMLSVLYLYGVKTGDFQMTISGILISAMFFFISMAKPLEKISREHPPRSLFNPHAVLSIALQFLIHFYLMYYLKEMVLQYIDLTSDDFLPDSAFHPNLLNTVMYILSTYIQMVIFLVNYRGHPFMQSIKENKYIFYSLIVGFIFTFTISLEIIPGFNSYLDLVQLPNSQFKQTLNIYMVYDLLLSLVVDRILRYLFKN
ncbi:hypothetical protein WA158_001581 [Blastocystis sp. Blastoise]